MVTKIEIKRDKRTIFTFSLFTTLILHRNSSTITRFSTKYLPHKYYTITPSFITRVGTKYWPKIVGHFSRANPTYNSQVTFAQTALGKLKL